MAAMGWSLAMTLPTSHLPRALKGAITMTIEEQAQSLQDGLKQLGCTKRQQWTTADDT
jgi:hypothetical protein